MPNHLTNGNGHDKGFDLDVRGLLAIMSILGAFLLAGAQLALGQTAEIPAWSAAIVAGVTGFYFGSRAGSGAEQFRQTGVAAFKEWYQTDQHLQVLNRLSTLEAAQARGPVATTPPTDPPATPAP